MPTYTSTAVSRDESSFKAFPTGQLGVRSGTIEVAAAADTEVTTAVYQMIPVYKGETVYDVIIQVDDLDAGTTLVLDVGDDLVTDRYIDGSTVGQTGGIDRLGITPGVAPAEGEFPFTYTADNTLDVAVQAASTTGATGTIKVTAFIG